MAPTNSLRGVAIGLISAVGVAVFVVFLISVFYCIKFTSKGRIFLDGIRGPGEYDDEQAFAKEEEEALETMDDMQRAEYLRAKAFIEANPPESMDTQISLSQHLAIQEKGVSAWEFEPELEIANCFVEARTEIEFFDAECSVLSNLPVPKQNEVYYWEAKIYEKPDNTLLSIGMSTKPYPLFRLPGFHKHSIAYLSNGTRRYNQPFKGTNYGPKFVQGDVIGVGYRPRTGAIFFTRNGKRLEDVAQGLKTQNFFPSIGANGPCIVHVNFGQAGFVFIEANVKKWGLAPMNGSLAPPPPYGLEQGSILLESGRKDGYAPARGHSQSVSILPYSRQQHSIDSRHGRSRSGNFRSLPPTSPGPVRSPTDISLAHLIPTDEVGEPSRNATTYDAGSSSSSVSHVNQSLTRSNLPPLGLGLDSSQHPPPPEYTSPTTSESGSRRNSSDSENSPLISISNRSRGASTATGTSRRSGTGSRPLHSPPIPSYSDAVREGAGRDRSDTATSRRNAS